MPFNKIDFSIYVFFLFLFYFHSLFFASPPTQVQYKPKIALSIDSNVAPVKSNFNSSSAAQLKDSSILDGSEVHFKCKVDANPNDVRIKWFINDTLVIGDYTTEMVIFCYSAFIHSPLVLFFPFVHLYSTIDFPYLEFKIA